MLTFLTLIVRVRDVLNLFISVYPLVGIVGTGSMQFECSASVIGVKAVWSTYIVSGENELEILWLK